MLAGLMKPRPNFYHDNSLTVHKQTKQSIRQQNKSRDLSLQGKYLVYAKDLLGISGLCTLNSYLNLDKSSNLSELQFNNVA